MDAAQKDKYVKLGLNIAYYRRLRKYTQLELCERLDISVGDTVTLVDADGKPLRASLGYGEGNWGVGSGVADYVFSHEDAYPEQVYLAPQMGEDSADMAWAIPLPMRK